MHVRSFMNMSRFLASTLSIFLTLSQLDLVAADNKSSSKSQHEGKEDVAFRDRDREPSNLYRRKEHEGNWDYQNNWREDPQGWLHGEDPFFHRTPAESAKYRVEPADPNWEYQENWRQHPNVYLRGEDQGVYYERMEEQRRMPNQRGANYQPMHQTQVINPYGNWDYQENWREHPQAYLRGQDANQYNEQQRLNNERQRQNNERQRQNQSSQQTQNPRNSIENSMQKR